MTALIKEDVERIIDQYIIERLQNYNNLKEELRQIKSGELVVVPASKTHAENLIRMGQFYLDTSNEN